MIYPWNHVYERKSVFQSINQYIIPTSPDGKSRQNLSGQFFALKEFLVDLSMGQFKFEQGQFCSFFPQVIGLCFLGNKVDEAILSQIFFESEDQF